MPVTVSQLRRVRWAVRATLLLGVAASVAANILHAQPNPIAQTIAAWPPVALLLTVELISRVPVDRRALAALRLLTTTGIAGIAAWVSYSHMQGVAARYGETGASPYLLPLSVDGLVVVASVSLVELAGRLRTADTMPSVLAAAVPASPDVLAGTAKTHVPPPSLDAGAASTVTARSAGDPPAGRSALVDPAAEHAAAVAPPGQRPTAPHAATRDLTPHPPGHQGMPSAPTAPDTTAAHRSAAPDVTANEPAPACGSAPPPADAAAAVAYWRTKDPTMSVRDLCARVGRSERTVRRILDRVAETTPGQSGPGDRAGVANGSRSPSSLARSAPADRAAMMALPG